MKLTIRLIKILAKIGHYRLDELLPSTYRRRSLSIILAPFRVFPAPKLDRGERLRIALEELGPIFIKFGQLLSTRPDIIPDDIAKELNKLQDQVSPFDSEQFKVIVESALGQSLEDMFKSFDSEPLASASIAQIHTATLYNNEKVVIKAVRPGIEKIIALDTALMNKLARLVEAGLKDGKRLRPIEVVQEYRQTIYDELDLMREAANASALRRNFLNSDKLYVPNVHWDYCRRNVMVMERIYGAQVSDVDAITKAGIDLKKLAERGVEIFFTQVFNHNFFHADMHPGNVYVDTSCPEKARYIALDMAIMGTLSREDQYYLARNLLAMFRRDYRQVAELHVYSGWIPSDTSIGAFETAIRSVCEPIFEKPLSEISFGEALVTLFQTARRFNMPVQPQLVLLQKTLINIEGLGRTLYPDLDLWATAHPFLEDWIKKRYSPKTIYKEIKRQAPEWLEKLPNLPKLSVETLEHVKTIAQAAPAIQASYERQLQHNRKKTIQIVKKIICLSALALAFIILRDANYTFNIQSISLTAVAFLALLSL